MSASDLSQSKAKQWPKEDSLEEVYAASRKRALVIDRLYTTPWWLIIIFLGAIAIGFRIYTDPVYLKIFNDLQEGVSMTLQVSFLSYFLALMIGLVVGIIRANPPAPPPAGIGTVRVVLKLMQAVLYHIATIYVQIMRGLPTLIVLLVTAFVIVPIIRDDFINAVIVPFLRDVLNKEDIPNLIWRGSSPPSAIAALAITYGAYMSETIRAGIQSVNKGQIEAAKSLGMTYWQTMRYVVLPQAFRNVLPPLGNDVISMIKDSSLLAILGIRDIAQVAKTTSGANFLYLQTYTVVAVIYLSMTIIGSLLVRSLEDTLSQDKPTPLWVRVVGRIGRLIFARLRWRRS